MIINPPKQINLMQLQQELQQAGVDVSRGVVVRWDQPGAFDYPAVALEVKLNDAQNVPQELSPSAQAVVAAHVAQPPEIMASRDDLQSTYAQALNRLDQIIGATSFTTAQLTTAVQDEARILRRLLRYVRNAS